MNVNYSEALERQFEIQRILLTPAGAKAAATYLAEVVSAFNIPWGDSDSGALVRVALQILRTAETYFVAPEISAFLDIASRSYPIRVLGSELPSRRGFLHLASPVPFREGFIDCLGWHLRERDDRLAVVVWGRPQGMVPTATPMLAGALEQGESVDGLEGGYLDIALRLLGSFSAFVGQKILISQHRTVERHARKRLARAGWASEPIVRVVELRRRERLGNTPTARVVREYGCQFFVRGHWRQQFYPSKHANHPIWITPYVKGPEDKPLKPPRATVFAVVR